MVPCFRISFCFSAIVVILPFIFEFQKLMSNYILLAFLLLYSVFKVLLILSYFSQSIQIIRLVGLSGLEPPTSRLSGVRSNRLSYKPRLLSKCADIWGYARGACTPEHKSLWMHMRRSRGMTGRRPGIPALANFKCWRSRPMTNRRFGIPALTNCKCWRSRLLLVLS